VTGCMFDVCRRHRILTALPWCDYLTPV